MKQTKNVATALRTTTIAHIVMTYPTNAATMVHVMRAESCAPVIGSFLNV